MEDPLQQAAAGKKAQTTKDALAPQHVHEPGGLDIRMGIGYDVHQLRPERKLMLGGVAIPYHLGLEGHSDADALIHAVVDALLGAAALGDLGHHFPSGDERWRGVSSSTFLVYTRELLFGLGWRISNIDATIVAEHPRMGPYISQMRENIARGLELAVERISVKATTTDGLGFAGKGEGVAGYAVATIRRD